ncbi:hypothetical protein DSO57_1008809 [Entomophthora muscae]|uniref:Uncharacterized protein n=1 Tax=Entomophthora muscae TaxID=34485 RepID=A0ACC2UT46_9FUNG|nr:hypothetical protein DSO57_1008809 [Entomophthora muscae]
MVIYQGIGIRIIIIDDPDTSTLVFGTPDGLAGVKQGKLWPTVPRKSPLVAISSLSQRHIKDCNIEQEQIKGATKNLEARYAMSDPVYALNPNSANLKINYTEPLKIGAVYNYYTYQLKEAQGNTKTLHHDCLCSCCTIPTQNLFECTFPDLPHIPILVHVNKQGAGGGAVINITSLSANLSQNTQRALDECDGPHVWWFAGGANVG